MVGTTTVSNRYRYPNFGPWPTSKPSLSAFASGSPGRVSEFHLSPANTLNVELLLASPRGQGVARAPSAASSLLAEPWALRLKRGPPSSSRTQTLWHSHSTHHWLGTFNRSNNLMGSLLWYYRACWHQNLAQIAFDSQFTAVSSNRYQVPNRRPINHLGPRPLDSFRACC